MTIKEATETIEKNPASFPSGLDTCYLDVLRFKVREEMTTEAMKFRVSADRFSSLAMKLDGATEAEMNEAYNDVRETLNSLNNCWCGHYGSD